MTFFCGRTEKRLKLRYVFQHKRCMFFSIRFEWEPTDEQSRLYG